MHDRGIVGETCINSIRYFEYFDAEMLPIRTALWQSETPPTAPHD